MMEFESKSSNWDEIWNILLTHRETRGCICFMRFTGKWMPLALVSLNNNALVDPYVYICDTFISSTVPIPVSKIQLVVYHQCCVLIGCATGGLYVIAH